MKKKPYPVAKNPDPKSRITYWEPGKVIRTTFKDYSPIIDIKVPAWKYGVPFIIH